MSRYKPIVSATVGAYHGKAIVGTYSAIIAWTFDDEHLRNGLKGFSIRRTDFDPETREILKLNWLGGYKQFKDFDNGMDYASSLDAPFQRFRWNDYTLNPELDYRYEVFPMRGNPGNLTRNEPPLVFDVSPSFEDEDNLGIYVNRGVTAAMAYLQRFKNRPPSEVGDAAYKWLSRGLKESLLNFINNTNQNESLHVAIYEFFDDAIAGALKDAINRGVAVRIVHDAKVGKRSTEKSHKVIERFDLLPPISIPRTTVNISHNKLVIRLVGGIAKEVWTGTSNFSEFAFNFQTNTALIIRDPKTVKYFEEYFQGLTNNPTKAESKKINRDIMDRANSEANPFVDYVFFSPIKKKEILDSAADMIKSAKSAVLVSAPFGLDKRLVEALHANSNNVIEYGLVNSTAIKKIKTLQRSNTRYFTPKKLKTYMGRTWDAKAFGAHKIHAKTIIIDPWGSNPQVLIGSANFSTYSCSDNDENALLIKGNVRLAAILTTEFMRMYDHYKSRFYIDQFNQKNKDIKKENKKRVANGNTPLPLVTMDTFLKTDDSWSRTSFNPNSSSHKFRDRIVFSGG
ncbi:phospholipase D-like domain-containing protein [Flagellimonas sp.]|uniref:phospholipase D-like domain-containing protein n=1 Tax=Flagellimonas sp. TaxID=2058762 RepID=UPI003BAB1608